MFIIKECIFMRLFGETKSRPMRAYARSHEAFWESMILSTLSVHSSDFAFGFPKRCYGDVFLGNKIMII